MKNYTIYNVSGRVSYVIALANSKTEALNYLGLDEFNYPKIKEHELVSQGIDISAKRLVHLTKTFAVCSE